MPGCNFDFPFLSPDVTLISLSFLPGCNLICLLGLSTIPICFYTLFPVDALDVVWPGNPYSVYQHCTKESCSNWEWTYSLLLWVISFFCIGWSIFPSTFPSLHERLSVRSSVFPSVGPSVVLPASITLFSAEWMQ